MKEWQPLVAGLGVALVLMGLFVASYVEALSAPKPREVPFGVAGSTITPLVNQIERQAGTTLKIKTYQAEADMRNAIDRQDIFGAVEVNGNQATLFVASASGPSLARGGSRARRPTSPSASA